MQIEIKADTRDDSESREQRRTILRRLAQFLLLAAVAWLALYFLHVSLPGIRSGADQVYQTKHEYVRSNHLFTPAASPRVLVFGNSKILSGFIPKQFDEQSGGESYNLGLPGTIAFLDHLEAMVERGDLPSHVLLTAPWPSQAPPSTLQRLQDDDWIMQELFPFRRLPRDAVLFLLRARSQGGTRFYYQRVTQLLEQMLEDRGYHFIESQSHYANHRLPDGFRADTDTPDTPMKRMFEPSGPEFDRLMRLRANGRFRILVVPTYARIGEAAPSQPDPANRSLLMSHGIEVIGPDYWLLPPGLFSDPVHLNPEGAAEFTRLLWRAIKPVLETAGDL